MLAFLLADAGLIGAFAAVLTILGMLEVRLFMTDFEKDELFSTSLLASAAAMRL